MSKKRELEMALYLKERDQFLSIHTMCQRCHTKKATDLHHRRGRSGSLLRDSRHWMAVCRPCHNFIGDHPEEARAKGWIAAKGLWNTPDHSTPPTP